METREEGVFLIRPYTKKELRLLYNLPLSTYKRWLRELPEFSNRDKKNWLSIKQVLAIVNHYGAPGGAKIVYRAEDA